jgi:hypothetical protein
MLISRDTLPSPSSFICAKAALLGWLFDKLTKSARLKRICLATVTIVA